MAFENSYEDKIRAESYAKLEYPGTYYLAFRDIPELISRYARGQRALDFGCGTGRSSRFLKKLGFDTTGIDISEEMLLLARKFDPDGEYIRVESSDLANVKARKFDLVLSAFTFDNIPLENKIGLFTGLKDVLAGSGIIVNLVSTPDMYLNEWQSFSTKDYPENKNATSGDIVKIITTVVTDKRPVEDIIMTDEAYRKVYDEAGLKVLEMHNPLAKDDEPYEWVNETRIAPWSIYVLGK